MYKRYKKMKDSGVEWIGEIPEHWDTLPIKFVVSIPVTDGPHETPELLNDGIPFISAEAIRQNKIDFNKKRGYISEEEHLRFCKKYRPRRNDIFLIKSGATTGNLAIVETDEEFSIWSPLAVIRTKSKIANSHFILYVMNSNSFQTSIQLFWNYGTQQNIGMNVIENLDIILPPLPEQQSIAAFLDRETSRIDKLIEKKERHIELLKEKRQALITRAVTKGLYDLTPVSPTGTDALVSRAQEEQERLLLKGEGEVENGKSSDRSPSQSGSPAGRLRTGRGGAGVRYKNSGVEWIGEIPEHWEVRKIKHIASHITDGEHISPHIVDSGVPLLSAKDVRERYLNYDVDKYVSENDARKFWQRCCPMMNDILIVSRGATIGRIGLIENEFPFCLMGSVILIKLNHEVNPIFIYYSLNLNGIKETFMLTSQASAQQAIYLIDVSSIQIVLPPVAEQRSITNFLEDKCVKIDLIINKIDTQISKLRELRQTLISDAVTGKIDVRGYVTPENISGIKEEVI